MLLFCDKREQFDRFKLRNQPINSLALTLSNTIHPHRSHCCSRRSSDIAPMMDAFVAKRQYSEGIDAQREIS